jgi:hypothetical protein
MSLGFSFQLVSTATLCAIETQTLQSKSIGAFAESHAGVTSDSAGDTAATLTLHTTAASTVACWSSCMHISNAFMIFAAGNAYRTRWCP